MLRVPVIGLGIACVALLVPGCAGSESGEPSPSLSQTRAAQGAFRNLMQRWFDSEEAERPLLRPALERFLSGYPREPRADNVRVLLAWIAITTGDPPRARSLLAQARASGAPSVRDFAEVAEARLLLAEAKPALALDKLTRLEGKLVDPAERLIATELRLQAALACQRFDAALRALTAYLAAAPVDLADRARSRAEASLGAVPEPALEASLTELDAKARRAALSPPDVWLRRVVRERLIRIAVEQKDAALARRLLDSHPGLAGGNELSNELLQLARRATSTAETQGAFVGFVLETGDADVERRSASVARGLSEALSASLPGAESLPIVVKASDAHGVGVALTELARAGALSIVAGVSDTSAEQAATWAVSGAAPVLIVRDTPDLVISELSFVLGTSETDQLDAIKKELARRSLSRWARVGSGGFDCRGPVGRAGQARFPVKDWKADDIEAIALLAPRACAMEVFAEAREERLPALLAIGLEGAEALASLGGPRFALGAGAFPSVRGPADMPPDFHEALGHDGGTLIRTAWSNMGGLSAAPDAHQREKLPSVLSHVTVQLGTTDGTGFGGKRRLPRRLIIREAP